MQYLVNITLPLESDLSSIHVLINLSSKTSRQGGTEFNLNEPPPIPLIASFYWDSLVEPHLPSIAPFQIKVQVEHYMVSRCIVDEGASISILSTHAWRGMGSPSLASNINHPLGFDRRHS